jgi:hypothetical protein
VLHRAVGGPAVMGRQLRELLRVVRETAVLVRVVPMAAAAPIALLGPFQILDLDTEGGAALYKEASWSDEIIHTPALVGRHREVFEELWAHALNDADSGALIAENADRWLTFASTGTG